MKYYRMKEIKCCGKLKEGTASNVGKIHWYIKIIILILCSYIHIKIWQPKTDIFSIGKNIYYFFCSTPTHGFRVLGSIFRRCCFIVNRCIRCYDRDQAQPSVSPLINNWLKVPTERALKYCITNNTSWLYLVHIVVIRLISPNLNIILVSFTIP